MSQREWCRGTIGFSARILSNIASNWVGYSINAAVTLLLTPFVLHQLGDARYGVWILASSIIGYYGLMDLGFRAGVTQYLTRYLALRDYAKASECMSSAVAALGVVGISIVGLSFAVAYIAPHIFDFPFGLGSEAFWCILIVGLSSALQCAFFPFGAVFTATQRFDLANLIGVATRLLMAGGIYIELRAGHGLIGVSAATSGAALVDYFIRWRVSRCLAPELKVKRKLVKIARLREVGSFGLWNFLISVSSYVYQYAHMLMIGYFLPIEATAYYGLAMGLSTQVRNLLGYVVEVFYPAATNLHFRGERNALERLYLDGTRLMLLVLIPLVLVVSFWAEDFYRLWIGERYLTGMPFPSVALLLRIILIGTSAMYASGIAGQILIGAGRVRLVAICVTLEAVLNLIFGLVSIRTYGLTGVAVSGVIGSLFVRLLVIPLVLQRELGLYVKRVLLNACLRPLAVGTLLTPLMLVIRLTGSPEEWLHLILQGTLAGFATVVVVLAVGVTAGEREQFLRQPLRRLLRREAVAVGNVKQ